MTYLGRLSSKGVTFSGIRYNYERMGFHKLRRMKGQVNLLFRDSILLVIKCC